MLNKFQNLCDSAIYDDVKDAVRMGFARAHPETH